MHICQAESWSFANIETEVSIRIGIGNITSSVPSDLEPPKLTGW